jgi:hypothetical protein
MPERINEYLERTRDAALAEADRLLSEAEGNTLIDRVVIDSALARAERAQQRLAVLTTTKG